MKIITLLIFVTSQFVISNLQSQTILYSPDTVNNSIYANSIEMNGNYLFVSGSLQSHPVARYVIYIYYLKDTIASLVDTFYDQEYNFDMVSSYGKYCAVAARSPLQSVGSVFMYHLENSKWNYLQKIAASDGTGANGFGNASIYRDEMIIGAPGDNVNGLGSGAAYIFKLQNGLWKEIQKLKPPDIQAGYHFGAPVKIYKDIAMVTASFANGMAGAVYVFRKTDTAWIQVQKIEHVGIGFENFGESIAIHNQFVLIGASNRDLQWSFQGVVYTYKNTDSTLINEQILSPTDALPMDGFGKSIDLQQSRIVIGAPGKDSIRGKVYVYRRIDSTFTPFAAIYPKDNFIPYRLGGDVSIQGNLIAASSIPLQYKNWHLRSVYLNEICGLPAISSDQANPVCPGDSVHLQAGCHKDSVNWYNSSGLLKANSRRYNFIASGKDSIWANIWTKGIFSGYAGSDTIVVQAAPQANFQNDTVCQNQLTHFTDLSYTGTSISKYSWDFDNDGITDDTLAGNTSYSFANPGYYPVKLKITNSFGCTDSILKTVWVKNCLGWKEHKAVAALKIEPNPNQGAFHITLGINEFTNGQFQLSDLSGKIIMTRFENWQPGSHTLWFDMGKPAPGVYIITLRTNHELINRKLVIY